MVGGCLQNPFYADHARLAHAFFASQREDVLPVHRLSGACPEAVQSGLWTCKPLGLHDLRCLSAHFGEKVFSKIKPPQSHHELCREGPFCIVHSAFCIDNVQLKIHVQT